MTLTVETGAMIANANSYVSVSDIRAYAAARTGKSVPTADADVEKLARVAMDYIEARREGFKGTKTNPAIQVLQWPRGNVTVDGYLIPNNTIPTELKNAQCELVCAQYGTTGTDGVNLFPNTTGKFTTSEQVDVLRVTYSENIRANGMPTLSAFENFLAPLMRNSGGSISLTRA